MLFTLFLLAWLALIAFMMNRFADAMWAVCFKDWEEDLRKRREALKR